MNSHRLLLLLAMLFTSSHAHANSTCENSIAKVGELPIAVGGEPGTETTQIAARCSDSRKKGALSCEQTYQFIVKYYREANAALENIKTQTCKKMEADQGSCAGQAEAAACVAKMQKMAAEQMRGLADKFQGYHDDLHREFTRRSLETSKLSTNPSFRSAVTNASVSKFGTKRGPQVEQCVNTFKPSDRSVCELAVASTEAEFFAQTFGSMKDKIKSASDSMSTISENSQKNSDGLGKEKDAGGGMNLNDMMQLATVGLMGGSMYCSMTGKCTPKDATSDLDPGAGGATSPTPTSSNFDSPQNSAGSGAQPDPGSPAASTDAPSVGASGGGLSSVDLDSPLGGASTEPHRAPASNSTVLPGSGSFSGSSSSKDSKEEKKLAEEKAHAPEDPTGGAGGGGLPGGGSFSLGDSSTQTPTDAALKDILNGENLPEGSLGELSDASDSEEEEQGSASQSEGDLDLFHRVRGSYARCLKVGCVFFHNEKEF